MHPLHFKHILQDDPELLEHYRKIPKIERPQAALIARDQWPTWAKALAQFAKPEDKGIGDVVARIIGDERSEKFKAWYLVTFGKPCGCNGRQNLWNTKYPLNLKAT